MEKQVLQPQSPLEQFVKNLQITQQDNPLHGNISLVVELRKNGFTNLDDLKIKIRRGTKHPNLIQFKYLIFASFKNPQCRDARGIVLDQSRNFAVVALPYYKFFDYDDPKHSDLKQFNFNNYKIYQKHDGSLASIYYYKGEWHVASSGIPDGQAPYFYTDKIKEQNLKNQEQNLIQQKMQQKITFRQQFWKVFHNLGFKLPKQQDQNKTFVFQLMSKNVTIVVKRDQDSMVLHGVRNIDTLQQEDPNIYGQKYNWKVSEPFVFDINNKQNPIVEILQITDKLDPRKQQGFILCDDKYLRLKVKNNNYKRIHWLKDIKQINQAKKDQVNKFLLEDVVLAGETQAFMTYCYEWADKVQDIIKKIQKMNKYVLLAYEGIKHLPRKQFALQTQKIDKRLVSFLFILQKDYNKYKNHVQVTKSAQKLYDIITNINFDQLLAN